MHKFFIMIKCTLEDIYEFNKLNNSIDNCKFKVKSRKGLKVIKAVGITAKNSKQIKIVTNTGRSIIGSPDHLLFYENWKKIKEFKVDDFIETENGIEKIKNIELLNKKRDLLDIEVDEAKEFFANGFVSHNSTISEVITFALYGKVEKKNKSDLVNRINKNLWCRIVIKSKNKKITITRGVTPNIFDVDIDGISYDTSGTSNVQDYLEYEIFDIPYQVFKNIIVLSINDFKSFLTMNIGDKRNIIDRLFGFSLINQMRDEIKQERKTIKEQIKTLSDELNIINESIESIQLKIKDLEKNKKIDKQKAIDEFKEKIDAILTKKISNELALNKIKEKSEQYNTLLHEATIKFNEHSYEVDSIEKKIKLYKQEKCPMCSSSLTTQFHKEIEVNLINEKETLNDEIKTLEQQITDLKLKSKLLSTKSTEVNQSIIKISLMINQYNNEIEKLKNTYSEADVNSLTDLISENENRKDIRLSSQSKNMMNDNFLDIIENILGEDGVKNLAMKTILPTLNQNIVSMAKQIHLPYLIRFDDKFNCIISALGEEINPKSMSTGERKKADFIIIIAMLKILKIRYPSLNILFLDEIFSSVDSSGIYEIIKILSDVSKENNLNTWVINHTELPTELFDKKAEVYKEGGFSKLNIETIS